MKKLLTTLTFIITISFSSPSWANDNPLLSPEFWKTATPDAVMQAIKQGNKINDRDKDGLTALMHASQFNQNPEIIETLIKHGANINDRDKDGWTTLMYAGRYNPNPEIIETLIKHSANVKAEDSIGKTALDYAKDNPNIYRTDVYWKMNNMMYE